MYIPYTRFPIGVHAGKLWSCVTGNYFTGKTFLPPAYFSLIPGAEEIARNTIYRLKGKYFVKTLSMSHRNLLN
jgi:hypothetical protein